MRVAPAFCCLWASHRSPGKIFTQLLASHAHYFGVSEEKDARSETEIN